MKDAGRTNSRSAAARIIARWLSTGEFPDRLIEAGTQDRAFVMEVVYGVARWKRTLEWVIQRCVPSGRVSAEAKPFLMTGLYQILMMESVVAYAAVSETVEAAKSGPAAAVGFVNAVLRRVLREKAAILDELSREPLGTRESHPDALVTDWIARFGEGRAEALCRWDNTRPDVTIRANVPRTTTDALAAAMKAAGVDVQPHPFAPSGCLIVPHGRRVDALPGYAEGLFSVQDPSTTAAVDLLDPRPGETVLDACAAPGGKTVLIVERMKGEGRLIAMDLHEDRLAVLRENIARLALAGVTVVQGDAAATEGIRKAVGGVAFDRILLDVPCSNTGVLRRRPDARWRFSQERLTELLSTQWAMLEEAAASLKPGGRLVYSTCSLQSEEGEEIIRAWLKDQPDFVLERQVTLFPPETRTDGIYAAALSRLTAGG